ncbi:MAG: NapC/NirT family cytochrome c [Phycisphaerae bacterium]|jgi:cytochrome c-type protein NapC/trimethylamine-N-oxide reductase cytochrome c-type subunit TorC
MGKYFRKFFRWAFEAFKKRALTLFVGFVFALLCFIAINAAMKPVSESKYCGSNCHEMHSALQTWEHSVHGGSKTGLQAECVDCHLPPKDNYFTHIIVKGYSGGKDLYKHYMARFFGTKYEPEKTRMDVMDRMKNKECVRCHTGLLSKPSNETIREAHMMALDSSGNTEQTKCVECHEDVGHKR